MNTKELSAEEYLKQISPNENYGLRSELQKHRLRRMVANTMESYATARLEAYKEEVYKKNIYVSSPLEQGISINERIYRQGLSDGVKSVLSSLNTCDPRNTECELYDKLRPFTTTAPLPPNFSKP